MEQTTQNSKLLSELLSEPEASNVPVNRQLYKNSDVEATFRQAQQEGKVGSEDFYNAKNPNLAIMHEKPEHRMIIFLKARGHSLKEIADAVGYTVPWVSQVLRQPWARARLAEEINLAGRDEIATVIESAAKDSMYTLIELRDDAENPASVRANVSQYLVDRFFGKPKQSVEQKIGNLDELSDEQLTRIASGSKTATATAT